MHKDKILQRLDLVNSTNNSIVATAAWCSLHAHEGHRVLECIGEKMQSPFTTPSQRTALVYVLHELLLSCSRNGVAQESKQMVLLGVRRILPATLKVLFHPSFVSRSVPTQGESVKKEEEPGEGEAVTPSSSWGLSHFLMAVEKSVEWWAMLQLFPKSWLNEVRAILRSVESTISSLNPRDRRGLPNAMSGSSCFPDSFSFFSANMQRLSHALYKYEEVKGRWEALQRASTREGRVRHHAEGVVAPRKEAITATGAAVHHCLSTLERMRETQFPEFSELQRWCQHERAQLHRAHAPSSSPPTGTAPPTEGASSVRPSPSQGSHRAYREMETTASGVVKMETTYLGFSRRSGEEEGHPMYGSGAPAHQRIKVEGALQHSYVAPSGGEPSTAPRIGKEWHARESTREGSEGHATSATGENNEHRLPPHVGDSSAEKKDDDDDILGSFF